MSSMQGKVGSGSTTDKSFSAVAASADSASQHLDTASGRHYGNHMVTNDARLDRTFAALADSTRRAILARLTHGDASVGELARPFRVSRPAISKHLRVLERAGLVRRERRGRVSRCELEARPMGEAADWVERYRVFWEAQLDALQRYAERSVSPRHEEDPGDGHA